MALKKEKITIVAILGSVRKNNLTSKALKLVMDEIKKYPDITLKLIDPTDYNLVLPGKRINPSIRKLQNIASEATGIVLATPEYHGSYSSVIKLIIENLGYPSVIAGKPVALLGVADGQIGAIKAIEHLRSVCSHVGAVVLPGVVSVAGINHLFDSRGRCLNKKTEERIRSLGRNLVDYIRRNICPRMVLEEFVRGKA